MYTPKSVTAAGTAIRAAFVSASRYAAHAVAPSESTTLGSGAACSRRPPTASTAPSRSPYQTTRRKTWSVGIVPRRLSVLRRLLPARSRTLPDFEPLGDTGQCVAVWPRPAVSIRTRMSRIRTAREPSPVAHGALLSCSAGRRIATRAAVSGRSIMANRSARERRSTAAHHIQVSSDARAPEYQSVTMSVRPSYSSVERYTMSLNSAVMPARRTGVGCCVQVMPLLLVESRSAGVAHVSGGFSLYSAQNSRTSGTHVTSMCQGGRAPGPDTSTVREADQWSPSVDVRCSTVVDALLQPPGPALTAHMCH